jgi:hypothetical protein
MNLIEAAQMALDALDSDNPDIQLRAATHLRAALAQPEREWQGLTNEEQGEVAWSCGAMSADWLDFARAIEAKLKEKNS